MAELVRHVRALGQVELSPFAPLTLAGAPIGYMRPAIAAGLAGFATPRAGGLDFADATALHRAAEALASAGAYRPRGEAFDVRSVPDGPVLARLDRAALPVFGVAAVGVHLNGMVHSPGEPALWVGTRAANKPLDPGKRDHLVAGGVPAGLSPWETLLKEAEEEAGIAPSILEAARASGALQKAGVLTYVTIRPEGLRRDRLHCYDLVLPADFEPEARDGEMARFDLLLASEIVSLLAETDSFKFNVALVLLDWLLRHRIVSDAALEAALARLRA